MCVLAVNFLWINGGLESFLSCLWITLKFSLDSVDFIHIVMNMEKSAFITVIRTFTQTHSPYY